MRLSLTVLAGLIVSASAASSGLWSRQQFPSCAGPCLSNAFFGSCQPNDYGCLCRSNAYINSVSSCFVNACSGVELQDAVSGALNLCAAVGVTLTNTLPSPTASSNSGGSTTTTQAAATSNAALANSVTPNALAGIIVFGLGALAL